MMHLPGQRKNHPKRIDSSRLQRGYLLEIPLIMAAVGMLAAIVVPKLPVVAGKCLVALAALVWIVCLYYMIVTPGWQPSTQPRAQGWTKLAIFICVAGSLVWAATAYIWFS